MQEGSIKNQQEENVPKAADRRAGGRGKKNSNRKNGKILSWGRKKVTGGNQ